MTVQQMVGARGITQLVHFTRLENLDSILNHGLQTRGALASSGTPSVFTDAHRLDYQDAICLSITFPNYKMFFPSRSQNPNSQWAVLGIRTSVLWEKRCAFCKENAASARVTSIPVEDRRGPAAFAGMFDDFGEIKRADLNIPDTYTTNPQAEVLVFDAVGSEYILGVAFSSAELATTYSQRYGARYRFLHGPGYFGPRADYPKWQKPNG